MTVSMRPYPAHPLRRVVRSEYRPTKYNRDGEGPVIHFLECGHYVWAKQSAGYPKRKRCWECARDGKSKEGREQ